MNCGNPPDFPFSIYHSRIQLGSATLIDGSLFWIGTAKRLRLKAQDRGAPQPAWGGSVASTLGCQHVIPNPEWVMATGHNRVAVESTIHFQTQGSRSGNPTTPRGLRRSPVPGLYDATALR